jgi:hypothetical protein
MRVPAAVPDPITDVLFMLDGIGWLKYLVASCFFLLGLFTGWWQWRYRRLLAERTEVKQGSGLSSFAAELRPLPVRILGQQGAGEFGFVYADRPDEIDDFQRIHGIGKSLSAKLHNLGIYRFDQIANWHPAQVAAVAKMLQIGSQIEKDEWLEQAKSLCKTRDSDPG